MTDEDAQEAALEREEDRITRGVGWAGSSAWLSCGGGCSERLELERVV